MSKKAHSNRSDPKRLRVVTQWQPITDSVNGEKSTILQYKLPEEGKIENESHDSNYMDIANFSQNKSTYSDDDDEEYVNSQDNPYWINVHDLITRLRVLWGSEMTGNAYHEKEILSIIEQLREERIIY